MSPEYKVYVPPESVEAFESLINHMPEWRAELLTDSQSKSPGANEVVPRSFLANALREFLDSFNPNIAVYEIHTSGLWHEFYYSKTVTEKSALTRMMLAVTRHKGGITLQEMRDHHRDYFYEGLPKNVGKKTIKLIQEVFN